MLKRACLACIFILLGQLAGAAERVVSLASSLAEMMLDLQAQHHLVGVLNGGKLAAGLEQLPVVGDTGRLDMERLLALQPDLVLYWPGSVDVRQLKLLEQLQIPVFHAQAKTMQQLAQQFTQLGDQVGAVEQGRLLTKQAEKHLAELQAKYGHRKPLRVFYQLWDKPMFTLGGPQIISDALGYCGAVNIFADVSVVAPQVDMEAVLARQPDRILMAARGLNTPWQDYGIKTVLVPDNGLERPSWQMFDALTQLCQALDKP